MKTKIFFLSIIIATSFGFAQTIPFNYAVKIKPITINNLPGLHSYAVAQYNGKWLVIGGRKDGIHARQPFNAFPVASSNTDIYVIDVNTQQFWTASVNGLPTGLKEQLQSTNMNFYQDKDSLYIIGGYGYSSTAVDHITYPNLTSISVSGLINAIVNANSITPYFKQITDQNFAVNGGYLGKIGSTFYLVGGHRFDGRYNPMGNPTYTQTYVDGLKKFKINNSGSQLSYTNYTTVSDQVHLHRRDYNLMPQIFPNGEEGYTISSGVFQIGLDLPFLYPVDIKASGHFPVTTFNQYLSNYHSAKTALYDSINNVMHSIFFGGMSQYSYINNVLTQDNNVPFVKTISRVSRDANGNLQENVFPNQMPALIGASAEFIPNHLVPHYESEIIKLSQITSDSTLIGHFYGGIYSPQINPFTANNTGVTNAHNVIYEVWIVKSQVSGFKPLDGTNPLKVTVFPNPTEKQISFKLTLPTSGDLDLFITDVNGKIVVEKTFRDLNSGNQTIDISDKVKLSSGVYSFNFVFDGKFNAIEKVIITQ
ncbi:MAG: T9SS type A sorting domain-containing protein [Bacteroidota bacterium]|nr:T9SS type A sorting domain-containing protein [Bacteroidota bacterium]MDP3145843.1 T9SS type A sorting domain-containing protein [Bacteroidota bacterium]